MSAEFRTASDPVAEAHLAMLEVIVSKLFPDPCGPACEPTGEPCGFHDARIAQLDNEARYITTELVKQPKQLYECCLIDVGEIGQPIANILAAVFRGEAPSVTDVEVARAAMSDLLMDEGRRLLEKEWAA